ncbi:MAG: DUF3570 domain-containing protein [Myxococcales bacterium]|nr:DUF3570 domain-containing protein [Myxococcales bacterium]
MSTTGIRLDAAEGADALDDRSVLGDRDESAIELRAVTVRTTSFNQYGSGYQSKAGPVAGPGSERATIYEPQLEVVAAQGRHLTHTIRIPIDVVSAASPDAVDRGPGSADVVSGASRLVLSGTLDWASTYAFEPGSTVTMDAGLHLEEPFRSWHGGLSWTCPLADGDTLVSANVLQVYDWFDRFDPTGHRFGRTNRSTTSASAGVTQTLTPTTLLAANYGLTLQRGELGNTWNSVPVAEGGGVDRGPELLPNQRLRHALVARALQFLPWDGALRLHYRFYADDWGLRAHSLEAQLLQRLSPAVYVGAVYRFHTQTGVDFFTTLAGAAARLRTADSDLAPFQAHTVGGKVVVDLPLSEGARALHFELGYERYVRSNDLSMDIVTCATGYRF